MNKSDLVREIKNRLGGFSQSDIRSVIDQMVTVIGKEVAAGRSVNLRGFGTFKAVTRQARKAQHPRTRKTISVKAKKVPVFRPSPEWKTALMKK